MNTLKTGILMAVLTVLVVLLGRWIGGDQGMLWAFVFALGMNFLSLCGTSTFGGDDAARAGTATATRAITAMRAVIERRMGLSLRSRRAFVAS